MSHSANRMQAAAAALNELKRREAATGVYRTRIAANILCDELIGGVVTPKSYFQS